MDSSNWEAVIGLEVHCQLLTKSKIFTGAATAYGAEPNTQADPVTLGLPGVLPFIDPVNIYSALSPLIFGLALMIFLIAAPRGLAHRWEIFKIAWKLRPFSH